MERIGWARIRFDDLQLSRRYERWTAYAQSKLANLLFAFELDRRARGADKPLKSVAAHPGYSATHLQTTRGGGLVSRLNTAVMAVTNRVLAQSDEMGALPSLYAATVPDLPGGAFVGPDSMGGSRGHPALASSRSRSRDEAAAKRLWEVSVDLTGVDYPALAKPAKS